MGDYVVFFDVAWHGANAAYFFFIGIAAMLYFVSALSWYREEFRPLRTSAFYLSFAALVVAGLILVGDLSQPIRFINTLNPAYWNWASPLVWGTILISLFGSLMSPNTRERPMQVCTQAGTRFWVTRWKQKVHLSTTLVIGV